MRGDSNGGRMRVSVIIATYGDEEWRDLALTRAFPSAKDQAAHEIIVGHDTNLAIGPVRNVLAEKATGDWLCFLDADDELAPGYLGAMERAWEQEGGDGPETTALLLTPAIQTVRNGLSFPPGFWARLPLEQGNWLPVGTLIHRDLFSAVGGFGDFPHGFEDWSLWLKASRAGARIVKVRQAVYRHHLNPHSKKTALWQDARRQVETHERVLAELCSP